MNAPISLYTGMTPNPVTMKFVLNFLLIDEQGTSIKFLMTNLKRSRT